jgi:hypothetical protein
MSTRQTQPPPIGWQNISATRRRALSRLDALWDIQATHPAAYEVPIGNAVAYHIPWENGSKAIGLGWNPKDFGLWYYAYMSRMVVELGPDISIFEYEDGRVRVFAGTLHTRPTRASFRKQRPGKEDLQIAGRRLRQARLRALKTQADLALCVSCLKTTGGKAQFTYSVKTIEQLISRFERGEEIPFPQLLIKAVEIVLGPLNRENPTGFGQGMEPKTRTLHKLKRRLPIN